MKRILNTKEVAEYVGLSPGYIRGLIGKQQFPYKDISRGKKPCFRFYIKELDKWIERVRGLEVEELID